MQTLIRGGYVVGFDKSIDSHVIYPDGEVVYQDNTIKFVGRGYTGEVDEVIDARSSLVTPGFINAHSCMDLSMFQLSFDTKEPTTSGGLNPRRKRDLLDGSKSLLNPNQIRSGALLGFMNMVRGGTTTMAGITSYAFKGWNDPPWEPEIYLEVAIRTGIRSYLSHMYRDCIDGEVDRSQGRLGLERAVRFIEKYHGSFGDRVRGLLFPYTFDSVSEETLRETRQAATELGVGIRMHFAQSEAEVRLIEQTYKAKPVEAIEALGFLGPDVLLTHCLFPAGLTPTEKSLKKALGTLVSQNTSVGHCPWVLIVRGFGPLSLDSLTRYLDLGVNICLGTDTFPQDMISEMRWAAILAKVTHGTRGDVGTAREVFDAATVNGARWLGREDLGRLVEGAKADINIIDLNAPNMGPVADPIRNLVYFGQSHNVKTVIVDGVKIVDDFRHLTLDSEKAVCESEPVFDRMLEYKVRWSEGEGLTKDDLSPTSYPKR